MTDALENLEMSSDGYTLAEIHREIAKDDFWRKQFRYLPNAPKAGLKYHLVTRNKPEKKLLVGTLKINVQARVYARVYPLASGLFDLLGLHFHDGSTAKIHKPQKGFAQLLQGIKYVEPFNRLIDTGSVKWRKAVRYLILYYFLEQQLINYSVFPEDGLQALKRACRNIAWEPTRKDIKPTRPLLTLPTPISTTNFTTPPGIQEEDDIEDLHIKREALPLIPLKAPENDSIRAISTMVQQNNDIAGWLLPKTMTGNENLKPKDELLPAAPKLVHEPKRKRPTSIQTTRGEENEEEQDPELVFGPCKRLMRRKIEGLESEKDKLQDTLNVQTISISEKLKSISSRKKDLLDEEARLEAEQAAKAATETRLEKVCSELNKKRIFEEGIDSFYN